MREVDAEADPAFRAVRDQATKLGQAAQAIVHLRKEADKRIYGDGKEWDGQKGFRDEQHREEAKQLETQHKTQLAKIEELRKQQFARLKYAWNAKRRDIRTTAADAKRAADAWVRDQTTNINERFGLAKAQVETDHLLFRETHQEWLRGRKAQGLPGDTRDPLAAQEGTRIAPGARGSREAIVAAQDALEVERLKALRDMEAQAPNKAGIDRDMQAELRATEQAERVMNDRLKRAYAKTMNDTKSRQFKEAEDFRKTQIGKKAREGEVSKLLRQWTKANKKFADAVWKHPSDNQVDLYFSLFAKHLLTNEKTSKAIEDGLPAMAKKFNWGASNMEDLRANPAIMRDLVQLAVRGVFTDPIFKGMKPEWIKGVQDSARDELVELNKQGIFPQYIPHVSETQLRADATGSYGIHLTVGKGVPKPDVNSSRMWDLDRSRYDVMAGIHRGVKQVLEKAAIKEFAQRYLAPHVVTRQMLREKVLEYYPSVTGLKGQGLEDFVNARLKDWGLVKFNPAKYGYKDPAWTEEVYINKSLVDAVKKVTNDGGGLGSKNVYDSATRLFRYSILGLSPRYTAHIVFGGTMLLALREPLFFMHIQDAVEGMRNGQEPEHLAVTSTNMGTTEYELSRNPKKAVQAFHAAGMKQAVSMALHEHMEKVQGIARGAETPIHWLKAMADLNLHFTSYVTHLQRSVAFTAGKARAMKELGMTEERATMEGMHNAERVMGDLRRMSPFERQIARYGMPFYGWQKHILTYVLTFPADHPWRAMMLANLAEFDLETAPGGLPSRFQFLFYLGQPDAQGNATAVDLRQVDPLRDVANYASLGGIVSSLNPVISAPLSMIDPQAIYGGNTLYPNLTYDQFYGIKEAGPQGNILTGAAQIVPELGALKTAMQAQSARQGLTGLALAKNIAESLNFPWVPQKINLNQEAAKTAIAQYQTTSSLAKNAWQTGDFSQIADLGSVPDPRNPDYETPVSQLELLYSNLSKAYPGVPPDQVAQPLPTVHL